MVPLVAEIGERFRTVHPNVVFDVQSGGSGRGVTDVRAGRIDIGMVSRALTERENDLVGYPIARDGVAVVVHRDNPIRALSDAQLRAIYTGRTVDWRDVGGRNGPIAVFIGEQARGSSDMFCNYLRVQYEDLKRRAVIGDNALRLKAIAADPGAIVYLSVGEAERSRKAGAPIKALPIAGVSATSRSIRSGNYVLSRPLTLVTKDLPRGLAKEFINFALSAQVTEIIERHDFVSYQD